MYAPSSVSLASVFSGMQGFDLSIPRNYEPTIAVGAGCTSSVWGTLTGTGVNLSGPVNWNLTLLDGREYPVNGSVTCSSMGLSARTPHCVSFMPSNDTCATATTIKPNGGKEVYGENSYATPDYTPASTREVYSCAGLIPNGPDVVYSVFVEEEGDYEIHLDPLDYSKQLVVWVTDPRGGCGHPRDCMAAGSTGSSMVPLIIPFHAFRAYETYYIHVGSTDASQTGSFAIFVQRATETCRGITYELSKNKTILSSTQAGQSIYGNELFLSDVCRAALPGYSPNFYESVFKFRSGDPFTVRVTPFALGHAYDPAIWVTKGICGDDQCPTGSVLVNGRCVDSVNGQTKDSTCVAAADAHGLGEAETVTIDPGGQVSDYYIFVDGTGGNYYRFGDFYITVE